MNKQVWFDIKQRQIELYRQQAGIHSRKEFWLQLASIIGWLCGLGLPWVMFAVEFFWVGFVLFFIIPVASLLWRLSRYETRSVQLLNELADVIEKTLKKVNNASDKQFEGFKKEINTIETRFLSNDDELFVKKAVWGKFMKYKKAKRNEERRVRREGGDKIDVPYPDVNIRNVWNTDIPHRQGYKDSNTIGDEWAIMKAFRHLFWADYSETYIILNETSLLAKKNPVVFERYLRKKKVSKKLKEFKWVVNVDYLSAAAKMRLVTFVNDVLALEPTQLNEATVTLLHEKNEQIEKYTNEFWSVHNRSIKFYWFEALWLLWMIPILVGTFYLLDIHADIEAILLFTVGVALVAFGEMALVVRQKIKLNGKKLIPPLIASLIGSRHAMCADTKCVEGIEAYRRRFKNLEKHFIMTTPEIDSVKYVKDNLRDEERTSKLHEADEICDEAQTRMDTYYRMFHLYRRRCLQYGALELFLAIMLVPAWGFALLFGSLFIPIMSTITVCIFEYTSARRHIRVWRFKEMYFKIYQGLSVLIVDGDLRQDPEKLNNMFKDIEQSALNAICNDSTMHLMAGTLSRVSGLEMPQNAEPHELDIRLKRKLNHD